MAKSRLKPKRRTRHVKKPCFANYVQRINGYKRRYNGIPKSEQDDGSLTGNADGGTILEIYLSEIGQIKLLTPGEEIELAKRIRKGDLRARESMIKANLRLVVKIAKDYKDLGVPLLDLINEGNMGLMKAVGRFDPRKGAKLSTYSSWWIKQTIKRALANQSKTIRLPIHMIEKISVMNRAIICLTEKLGREPTDDELAENMDIPVRKIRLRRRASLREVSLDSPIDGSDPNESNRLGDLIGDDRGYSSDELAGDKDQVGLLSEMIKRLEPREVYILKRRFGLNGNNESSLEDIGTKLKITRERVRQIEAKALRRLRFMFYQLKL